MKLYFIRHGRTQWNEEGRFQGASGDSPLLDSSIEELHALGKYLSHIPFDKIYSSDLPRAIHTAEIINQENDHSRTIHLRPALREWKLGKLEGAKISTIKAIYPQQMEAFRHNLAKFNNSIFDAESVYQTTHRVMDFVHDLNPKEHENVLIVGHGANLSASIKTMLGYDVGLLRKDGGLKNASLTILETQDGKHFDLLTWNNLDYLLEQSTVK